MHFRQLKVVYLQTLTNHQYSLHQLLFACHIKKGIKAVANLKRQSWIWEHIQQWTTCWREEQ